jgi:hypothetical protein
VLWLMAAGEITIDEASRIARLIHDRPNQFGAAAAASERPTAAGAGAAAGTASPAFNLQPAGDAPADPAAPPRPLNRHERRRAAALERAARPPTPPPTPLTAAA